VLGGKREMVLCRDGNGLREENFRAQGGPRRWTDNEVSASAKNFMIEERQPAKKGKSMPNPPEGRTVNGSVAGGIGRQ